MIEISRLVALRGLVREDIAEAGHSTGSLVSEMRFLFWPLPNAAKAQRARQALGTYRLAFIAPRR